MVISLALTVLGSQGSESFRERKFHGIIGIFVRYVRNDTILQLDSTDLAKLRYFRRRYTAHH